MSGLKKSINQLQFLFYFICVTKMSRENSGNNKLINR
jgi:hypothetical protein